MGERVQEAQENPKVLCSARERSNRLADKRASLTVEAKQMNAEGDSSAIRQDLQFAAAKGDRKQGGVVAGH